MMPGSGVSGDEEEKVEDEELTHDDDDDPALPTVAVGFNDPPGTQYDLMTHFLDSDMFKVYSDPTTQTNKVRIFANDGGDYTRCLER